MARFSASSHHEEVRRALASRLRPTIPASLFLVLLTALAAWPSQSASFQWPDSSHYWRVLVNVNQYIESRPESWFVHDKIVTDLQVLDVTPANYSHAVAQYQRVRALLDARGMYVGTYISGRTVGPASDQKVYPPGSVSLEQMPPTARYIGSWPSQPDRKIIDVTDAETRRAFHAGMKQLWEDVPAPIRFVDNAAIHPAVQKTQPWEAYCENMAEIRHLSESMGSRVIFNIAMHVGLMSDEDARELIDAVGPNNGIALEMPWHPNIQKGKDATAKAVARYRQLLDSGLVVIMIPVDESPQMLADWVRTWRKPDDHIYISGIFWKEPDMSVYYLH